jgi:hypothetical protein
VVTLLEAFLQKEIANSRKEKMVYSFHFTRFVNNLFMNICLAMIVSFPLFDNAKRGRVM